jgi:hypothetical protein
MSRSTSGSGRRRAHFRVGCVVAALIASVALAALTSPSAYAADDALTPADQQCLGCHGSEGLEKKLANDETLSLHVPGGDFAKSVHGVLGCAGCHADIKADSHPPSNKDIKSLRDYSVAAGEACRGCHGDKFEQWEKSVHATLVRDGNPAAPICADCHRPHAVTKAAAASVDATPCQNCHFDIFTAYSGSMHARAQRNGTPSHAPLCSGCHSAHDVKPVALGEGPKAACLACHAGALEAHRKWLPNAALHFESVACAACHAPGAQRKVDLMLYDTQSKERVSEQRGVPVFEPRATNGQALDALALWNLLQTLNRERVGSKAALRGRLEVGSGPQAHQLADKSKAISDCRTCHRQGSEAFQTVTISVVGPDGRRVRVGANPDVLSSVISIDAVRGFYAIGGTRIMLLDILLVLAFLGGLAVPVGHLTMRWLFKRYLLANPQLQGPGGPAAGGDAPKAA